MNKLITRLEDTDLQMGEIECSISEDRLGHVSTLFIDRSVGKNQRDNLKPPMEGHITQGK
jgi:hypothetical protein